MGRVLRAHVTKNAIVMEYDDKRTVAIQADGLNVEFGFHGTRAEALAVEEEPDSADR